MEKTKIENDMKFRQRCSKYGLDWENFEIYDEVILLNTPIKDLYVLFDKNYNTIAVEKKEYSSRNTKIFAKEIYERYSHFNDILPFGYPFEEYTLKNFIDLANIVDIMETNHGHSLIAKINGDWYDREDIEKEDYFELLSYVKFIDERIKHYFLMSYHIQAMGFETVDIYSYVRCLINNINDYVSHSIEVGRRPHPSDIISSLGLNGRELNCDVMMLYDVSELLMRENGVKVKSGKPELLEQLPLSNEKMNLSLLATKLLKILEVSDEELIKKEREDREKLVDNQVTSIKHLINEDIEDGLGKGPVLKKKME
jgi:hypothetical protein